MPQISTARNLDFSFLDQSDFREKYASGPMSNHIRFYIGGIKCGKCVRKLEDLSLTVRGLRSLRIEMGKNLAHAEVEPGLLKFSDLAAEIAKLGFKPIPLSSEVTEESARQQDDRAEMMRLAVAAACAGNIMTFSFATYLGAAGSFQTAFSWLSLALYLPVVTYVAWPFYLGAWNSLRQRQLSIDLPMAVASLSGFVFSLVELLRARDDIYFDSLSGFLFLILLSRWFQKRLQRKLLRPEELLENLQLACVRKIGDGGSLTWTPIEHLQAGDRLKLIAAETLAADAELLSERAYFSLAWLSGESKPRTILRGAVVPAGARLTTGEAELIARRGLPDTTFGNILREVQRFNLSKINLVTLADRWAQWLLGIVFAVAILFLLAFWQASPEEAIRRSLALIILACPCAMAFGTPLALATALRKARNKGLVIRSANVFEQASKVRTIFFDKTGTLTDSDLTLKDNPDTIPRIYQKIILSLENESMHPIAFALRKAFEAPSFFPPVDSFREVPGVGVGGFIYGRFFEIKRSPESSTSVSCTLYEEHQPLITMKFSAKIKAEGLDVLNTLRGQGYRLVLLSGDKKDAVDQLGARLGFAAADIYSEIDPARKAFLVAQTPGAMMVGDGVNDSLAMIRAGVGVAVAGGMEAALKSSDVYMTNESLEGIPALIELSRQSLALIRRNLTISVIYNTTGGILALLGFVNPFVAAVLMPVSSGFILLSTWLSGGRQ